jgi:hypothetical protein
MLGCGSRRFINKHLMVAAIKLDLLLALLQD